MSHRGLRPAQTSRLRNVALGWGDVVHGDRLAGVLSEFARTMVTDFPIQRILDHLVERIVEVLPVTAAGVTLIDEELAPRYIAASDQNALRFERLQSTIGQGPCLAAYESGEAVSVPAEPIRVHWLALPSPGGGISNDISSWTPTPPENVNWTIADLPRLGLPE